MSLFAVIKVDVIDPNEGYITDVDCLRTYTTKEEAEAYVAGIYEFRLYGNHQRNKRIEAAVEGITVPMTANNQEWIDFLTKLGAEGLQRSLTKTNFKNELIRYMKDGHKVSFLYDFGRVNCNNNDLHVVEIKESK